MIMERKLKRLRMKRDESKVAAKTRREARMTLARAQRESRRAMETEKMEMLGTYDG